MRISVPSTFGRLNVLPLIPELLSLYPEIAVDLVLSDLRRDMVEDRIDLAIRIGPVDELDAVVKRAAATPLVCVGSRRYFNEHGFPRKPADLADHNCLIYGGMREAADWPFLEADGPCSVRVRGNLSSNSVEAIRSGVLAGLGVGLFTKISLSAELAHPDIVTVLDDFVTETRDISIVRPRRRVVPIRVRRVADFFAQSIPQGL